MDGLAFVRSLLGAASMPMAAPLDFVFDEVTAGSVRGRATPATRHQNPEVIHAGQTIVVGEARLFDRSGKLYAGAQSTSIVARE